MQIILAALALLYPFILAKKQKTTLIMEESVDLSKDGVTQKPREWPIRRDEVQWTAMSISFKPTEMCPPSTVQTYRQWISSYLAVLARICPLPVDNVY